MNPPSTTPSPARVADLRVLAAGFVDPTLTRWTGIRSPERVRVITTRREPLQEPLQHYPVLFAPVAARHISSPLGARHPLHGSGHNPEISLRLSRSRPNQIRSIGGRLRPSRRGSACQCTSCDCVWGRCSDTWVSREEGSSTRAAVEAARWQMGLHAIRELQLPSWEAVKLAVASGAGIAAVSRLALELELAAGRLIVLDVPRWRLNRTIAIVTAREVPLTPPAARFLSLLRRGFDKPAADSPANREI